MDVKSNMVLFSRILFVLMNSLLRREFKVYQRTLSFFMLLSLFLTR